MKDTEEKEITPMTNEEYRERLQKLFGKIDDNRLLQYFYIFVSEKIKRVP